MIILLLYNFFPVFAQKWKLTRYEVIVGIGTTSFFGDIGRSQTDEKWLGLNNIRLLQTRPSLYFGARYKLQQEQAIKLNFTFAWINANDVGFAESARGYRFNAFFSEQSIQYEYSIITEDRKEYSFALFNKRGMINNYSKFNIYFFGGLGGLLYKPWFNGNISKTGDLPLKITGYTLVIPVGIGIKYAYSNRYFFGFELGGRYAFSDHLDGIDTKGYSKHNDMYYFGIFNVIYRLRTSNKGYPILRDVNFFF